VRRSGAGANAGAGETGSAGSAASIFPLLLLAGRPASGKSEIVEYLRLVPSEERRGRYHVGELAVLDDFPLLWAWFEEDRLLAEMGRERLHTTPDGYFVGPHLWDLLVRRLCLEYDKLARASPQLHARTTVLLEFSRGREHGGYARAFAQLSESVLQRLAVVYVRVSFQESWRKNRRRFNPERPHSILEHSLPDEKLEKLYREDDWDELSVADPHFLEIGGRRVPYAVFENEDDLTTPGGKALGERLAQVLGSLWLHRG
jgi:hypothetical protein